MILPALKLPGTIPQCRCHCWRVSGKKDASIKDIALGEITKAFFIDYHELFVFWPFFRIFY